MVAADIAAIQRFTTGRAHVVVVGQGYVGLSLACAASSAGLKVTGYDVDAVRVGDLNAGHLTVPGVPARVFEAGRKSGNLGFTADPSVIADADAVMVCVPTPLHDHLPDLSFVRAACTTVTRYLAPGTLVVVESTTYPGTTEDVVRPLLEAGGLRAGTDFLLAYCPERIDPGNRDFAFGAIPRVIGGLDETSAEVARTFYQRLVDEVVVVRSCRSAELAKLLENTFRHVNIALVNEMAMLCHETSMDVWEAIDAASTKPFGFMPFQPGPGVGGHCIPLDPTYLAWQMRRDVGHQFRILEQSQDINARMPAYVGDRISEALNDQGKSVKGSRVLVLGVSYKPGIGDVRESPSLKVMSRLAKRGADVAFHDPFVETVPLDGEILRRGALGEELTRADIIALLTPHETYDLPAIARDAKLVFDARNAYRGKAFPNVVRL